MKLCLVSHGAGTAARLACLLSYFALAASTTAAGQTAPDDGARMQLAAEQLIRTQLPSGLFPYDYDFATGAAEDMTALSGQNIVRQGCALFGLVQYGELADSERLHETVSKALRAFADRSLPVGKGTVQIFLENIGFYNRWQLWEVMRAPLNFFGLLYSPRGDGALVSGNATYERAWPGATALALVSELYYRRLTGDERFAAMRGQWLRGLLALHVPGRGFRVAPHYLIESGYVNGEAWLALAEYSRAFPVDSAVAAVLSELDGYMIDRYGKSPNAEFFHWGAMAAASRLEMTGDPRFERFIRDQADWFLRLVSGKEGARLVGCAWVEGLATAYVALERQLGATHPLMVGIRRRVETAMARNRALQILPGQETFVLDDSTEVRSPEFARYAGGFLVSSTTATMQVDVAGHCLSALVRMQRAGLGRSTGVPPPAAGQAQLAPAN